MNDVLFELDVILCERFPAFTPLNLRRERAADVFCLIADLTSYLERENKRKANDGKKVIRRPAGDDWF